MRIGIITDVHNNVVALKAILQKFQSEKCDGIICCGDIIGIGPYPEETVSVLTEIPNMLACVKGNHERYLVEGIPSEIPNSENMGMAEMEHHKWEHSLLSNKSKDYMKSLKYEEWITINSKRIYISHFAIDENNRYFTNGIRNHSANELDDLFGYVDADIILYGHEHKKSILKGIKHYINCGSLGCPMKDKNIARAGILTVDKDFAFTDVTVEYDVEQVLKDMENLNYPAKDEIKRIFYGV